MPGRQPPGQLIGRHGAGDVVTLTQVAAQLQQQGTLFDRFHALCNDLQLKRASQSNHGGQNCQVTRLLGHVANKALVYLDLCDVEAAQVREGGITGAKVVQDKMDADRPALRDDA